MLLPLVHYYPFPIKVSCFVALKLSTFKKGWLLSDLHLDKRPSSGPIYNVALSNEVVIPVSWRKHPHARTPTHTHTHTHTRTHTHTHTRTHTHTHTHTHAHTHTHTHTRTHTHTHAGSQYTLLDSHAHTWECVRVWEEEWESARKEGDGLGSGFRKTWGKKFELNGAVNFFERRNWLMEPFCCRRWNFFARLKRTNLSDPKIAKSGIDEKKSWLKRFL